MVLAESSTDSTRKTNKWVLEQIKPETLLEAKMKKLKLFYFGHFVRRQGSLGETIMLGKIEGSRKRERPNIRSIDILKKAIGMSLQKLGRAAEDRTLWTRPCGHHSSKQGLQELTQWHIMHMHQKGVM